MSTRRFFAICFLLLLGIQVRCAKYYISNSGNDNSNGLSKENAWNSIKKFNDNVVHFKSGDSVLFKRGDVFSGSLLLFYRKFKKDGLYIGAYGKGYPPLISGYSVLNNWKPQNSNINLWACKISLITLAPFIKMNGEVHYLSRYPVNTTLWAEIRENGDLFYCDDIVEEDGYWDNAVLVVRTRDWILDKCQVKKYSNKKFELSNLGTYEFNEEVEFFIQNHKNTLKRHGDWYYDKVEELIYLRTDYSVIGDNNIKVPYIRNGAVLNNTCNIKIEGISFEGYAEAAVTIENSDNIKLNDVLFQLIGINAIVVSETKRFSSTGCTFNRISNNAVDISQSDSCWIEKCSFKNIGHLAGIGSPGNGNYNALNLVDNVNVIVSENIFDTIGYIPVSVVRSDSNRIFKNIFSNYCLIKQDGGAIYFWNSSCDYGTINNNIILGVDKQSVSYKENFEKIHGIYIDDRSSNYEIRQNSIKSNYSGIFIHNSDNIVVQRNNLFDNQVNLLFVEGGSIVDHPVKNCHINQNLFVSTNPEYKSIELRSWLTDGTRFAHYSDNIYLYAGENKSFVFKDNSKSINKTTEYRFKEWSNSIKYGNSIKGDFKVTYGFSKARFLYNLNDKDVRSDNYKGYFNLKTREKVTGSLIIPSFRSVIIYK